MRRLSIHPFDPAANNAPRSSQKNAMPLCQAWRFRISMLFKEPVRGDGKGREGLGVAEGAFPDLLPNLG